jgi:hypothetical protein
MLGKTHDDKDTENIEEQKIHNTEFKSPMIQSKNIKCNEKQKIERYKIIGKEKEM